MRKLLLATVAALGASMGVAAVADAQTTTPAPGTVTVRLNGRVRFYAAYVLDGDTDRQTSATNPSAGSEKQSNYQFGVYGRLYPGFDGVAANGLKYGASLEIRQDGNNGAGGGSGPSISGSNQTRDRLYFRRAWGYIGTDTFGTVRLGMVDSPSSIYMTGNFENFDGGGLNGDIPGFLSGASGFTWPFLDVGAWYTPNKVVYLSPQFYGVDFGVSYEPNTGAGNLSSNCTVSGPLCDRLSSTGNGQEVARRKNTMDALIRYRGTFGPVGVAATAAYIVSGSVNDSRTPTTRTSIGPGGTVTSAYNGHSIGDFGLAVTYAGFSVGGKYLFGQVNGQAGLQVKGTDDAEAFLVGASYTFGPAVVGLHYVDYKYAGDTFNALNDRQRREQGLAAGGTYRLAPGLSLFASYAFVQRKQNGFNFVSGASSGPDSAFKNKLTAQVFALGTSFTW